MIFKNNMWFYLIQTLSWGLFTLINILFKMAKAPELNKNYTIAEGIIFFSAALFISSLLRHFIKKNNLFTSTKNKTLIQIAIALVVSDLLLSSLVIGLSYFSYNLFHEDAMVISGTLIVLTLVNTFIYLFMWLMCYRIIKMTQVFKQHKEERQKLKTTLKESELNTLKGQINPHFMFNSLNNIRGLMLEDVTKSRKMITCLSDMLRYSLAQNKADFIALKDELEMVSNYIALSKIQLENRLQYQQHIDANLLSKNIPPMVIQILLENAIKHGISNVIKGGHINLDVYNLEHQLVIKVTNTGVLKTDKMSPKVGLENIKKRLHLLYKDNANFTLYEKDKTVIATIKLPL